MNHYSFTGRLIVSGETSSLVIYCDDHSFPLSYLHDDEFDYYITKPYGGLDMVEIVSPKEGFNRI